MLKSAVPGHPISPYYLAPTTVPFAIGTDCREVFTVLHAGALLTFPLPWEEGEVGARIEGAFIIATPALSNTMVIPLLRNRAFGVLILYEPQVFYS